MGFLGKIVSGIGVGAKTIWRGFRAVDDVVDRIPFAKNLAMMVPVAGPFLQLGMEVVDLADERHGDEPGEVRRAHAIKVLGKLLEQAGQDPKHAAELVTMGYLASRRLVAIGKMADVDGDAVGDVDMPWYDLDTFEPPDVRDHGVAADAAAPVPSVMFEPLTAERFAEIVAASEG